jgi:predicted enzyme related to lactoylglutathione lyase
MPVTVSETFFSVGIRDMARATAFYCDTFGARVAFATPAWTSLHVAGVRLGLAFDAKHTGGATGLHFAVANLVEACAEVERAGGRVEQARVEAAPGVVLGLVVDTEGNGLTLTQR